jgi:hypothetical protein
VIDTNYQVPRNQREEKAHKMEDLLKQYNDAKSNLSSTSSSVSSANSTLLSAGSALKAAIDSEIQAAQAAAATTTGLASKVQSA